MSADPQQPLGGQRASGLLLWQVLITLAMAAVGFFISEPVGLSMLLGAGVGTLANGVFAYWIFRRYRAQEPQALVMRFYGAELAKIGLTLALFVIAFIYLAPLSMPALLGAYLVVQVAPALLAARSGAV